MSSRKWLAAATLMALAMPAAQAGDRTRVQITIARYWGWDSPLHHRPVPRPYARGYRDGFRDGRFGDPHGGFHGWRPPLRGGPVLSFDYAWRDRDRWYRHDGWRPGGSLRYDGRRDRRHGRDWDRRDWDRGHRDWDRRDRDRRDWDRRDWHRHGRGRDDD